MARQDDWVRMQVRLPRELHAKLLASADEEHNSLNSEIVDRLELSFQRDDAIWHSPARLQLDAEGRALAWEEINRHVTAIVEAFPDPITSVTVEVLTPEIIAAVKRREEVFNAEFGWARVGPEDESE